ncbi:WIN1 [Scenedesmus sp. PABB004]|nr:WIN1 [Scenedesmus sp. PABB004]
MPGPDDPERIIDVKPLHVLLLGAGVLGSGVLLTASLSYKQAGKQLAAEGIDASVRRRVLPHALKALAGSLLLTGLAAAGGFAVMEAAGLVQHEAPTSVSAFRRAWEMVGRPLPPREQYDWGDPPEEDLAASCNCPPAPNCTAAAAAAPPAALPGVVPLLPPSSPAGAPPLSLWPKGPRAPVFDDPWTKKNIALVYAHQLKDGVGAQTMRMLEIYAVANSLGIGYLHRPISCVGHIGDVVHYRDTACNLTREADVRLLAKIRRMIMLPSTVSEEQVATWEQKRVSEFGWWKFVGLANEALRQKRPTLYIIEFATSVAHQYPNVFLSVPAFRPSAPETRLVCKKPTSADHFTPGKPWLLSSLRVAIHFRRGDIATNLRWSHRMLPTSYYVNLARQITDVLDGAGCDYSVEVYTEAPTTVAGKEELDALVAAIPNAVLQASTDMVWSWQQMATCDVLVMSNSAFSISAALLNPNAFSVFFPGAQVHQSRIELRHWHTPLDRNGTLSPNSLEVLRRRTAPDATRAAAGAAGMPGLWRRGPDSAAAVPVARPRTSAYLPAPRMSLQALQRRTAAPGARRPAAGRVAAPRGRLGGVRASAAAAAPAATAPADVTAQVVADEAAYVLQTYGRPADVVFVRGAGSKLYDAAGREFLDMTAGIAVNALGHSDPRWLAALTAQAGQLAHTSNLFHTKPQVDLAKRLVGSSFADKAFFCNSGTEANEGAIKFARKYARVAAGVDPYDPAASAPHELVSFTSCFHGRTMGALALTYKEAYKTPFLPVMPGAVLAEYNNLDSAAAAIVKGRTAAVFVEPVQGEGGCTPSQQAFLSGLRELCDAAGALLVFDEVQCGLGRTGKLWGYEHYGVAPDLMSLAKPLAGGLPIGAVLLSQKVADVMKPGDHGSTFAGNPLVCGVACSVFDTIADPAFLAAVEAKGERLRSGLRAATAGNAHVKEVRGLGLLVGVQLDFMAGPVVEAARAAGVLVITAGKGDVVRLVPPLTVSEEEIDTCVAVLAKVLAEVAP